MYNAGYVLNITTEYRTLTYRDYMVYPVNGLSSVV